jgi:hypothetical protein
MPGPGRSFQPAGRARPGAITKLPCDSLQGHRPALPLPRMEFIGGPRSAARLVRPFIRHQPDRGNAQRVGAAGARAPAAAQSFDRVRGGKCP